MPVVNPKEDNKFQEQVELAVINCGSCGGIYAITESKRHHAWQYGESWNCPYCKIGWGYSKNNQVEKLKRELEAKESRLQAALSRANDAAAASERERNRANGYKGVTAKLKKRVGNGVCPCCTRTFSDLQRHMISKHPAYKGKAGGNSTFLET